MYLLLSMLISALLTGFVAMKSLSKFGAEIVQTHDHAFWLFWATFTVIVYVSTWMWRAMR